MPAHIWEITQQGYGLLVSTRWEGDTNVASFYGRLLPDEAAFLLPGSKLFKAMLVDKQHFVIAGWCTNDARGGNGPDFDVVFSRPGIAELTARRAYSRYLTEIVRTGN
jgi:hypothetical protein